MKTTTTMIVIAMLSLLSGCASSKNAYPITRVSGRTGEISSAHVINAKNGTIVSGSVKKKAGQLSAAWSHVDVIVYDKNKKIIETVATDFFPAEVPATYHGIVGTSTFATKLANTPPIGAEIKVVLHQVPLSQCGFAHIETKKGWCRLSLF